MSPLNVSGPLADVHHSSEEEASSLRDSQTLPPGQGCQGNVGNHGDNLQGKAEGQETVQVGAAIE